MAGSGPRTAEQWAAYLQEPQQGPDRWDAWGITEADRAYASDCALALALTPVAEDGELDGELDGAATGDEAAPLPVVLSASLREAGFPDHIVTQLCALSPALSQGSRPSKRPSDAHLADAADALVVLQRWADAALTTVLRDLAAATGEELLARADVASPEELSRSRRDRWRAQTKSVLANELQLLSGWGIQDCHDRVGFALAPAAATRDAEAALAQGEADWRQARAWWQACRRMPIDVASDVARRTVSRRSRARPARNDERTSLPDQGAEAEVARQSFSEVKRALERELARVEGTDPGAARQARRDAVARRDATAEVEDHGTGALTVTGSTSSIVAAVDRVDTIARRARAAGDPRTIAQLRADLTLTLLIHGTLPTPLTPAPAGAASSGGHVSAAGTAPTDPGPADGPVAGVEEAIAAIVNAAPAVQLEVIVPLDALVNPGSTAVAEIPGRGFLTAEHARDIALHPGGVLHRLVTDPLDGRLVERSIRSYHPDRAMIEQIRAADVHCRAPGCTVPAARCQHDHERPYTDGVSGGLTSESNLSLKHGRHHQLKTWDVWQTEMDATRRITWTTLFGRCYTTRPHDYAQYTGCVQPTDPAPPPSRSLRDHDLRDHDFDDPDLRDRLVYAALAHRDPGDWLAGDDDHPESELALTANDSLLHPGAPIRLRHRIPGAPSRSGPPPGQRSPRDILHPVEPTEDDRQHPDGRGNDPGRENGPTHHGSSPAGEPPPPF